MTFALTLRRARLVRTAVALCLLSVPGLACGGNDSADEDPADGVSVAGEATAEMFDTDLAQICRGTGQPRAATYSPGPGVHPVLVLTSDDGATFYTASTTLPDGWSAVWPDLERTELVVCAQRVSATPGQVCDGYADEDSGTEWSVQIHEVVYAYSVRVAQTAEVLGETTFEVPAGTCPMLSSFSEGDPRPKPYYPLVADGQVELFVRPFVTGG